MNPNRRHYAAWLLAALLAVSGQAGLTQDHSEHGGDRQEDRPTNEDSDEREIAYWVAPMDPNYRQDGPGKSPMGMDLIPVYVDQLEEAGQVRVNRSIQQNMNLRTTEARRDRLWRRVDTVGRVQLDESAIHHVHLRFEGWVQHIDIASEGEPVEAGQRLFTIYSSELVSAQDEYLQALRRGEPAFIESAASRLRAMGVQSGFIEQLREARETFQEVPWHAHRDGVVTRLGARHGMFVSPGDEILEITDLSSIWVIADVFARHAQWLEPGHRAEIRTAYRPGQTLTSRIDYVYPLLDPETRTVRVRLPLDNPSLQLKPGMWTDVRIFAGPVEDQLIIPREALIRTGKSERVVLRIDDDLFEVREVVSGMESGEYVAIVEGLEAGDTVVTSGQFLIDSEASRQAGHDRISGDSAHDQH